MNRVRRIIFLLACTIGLATANAQYTLRLIVNDVAVKDQDDIYVAGNFNSWNVRDVKYKLKPFGTKRRAIILKDLAAGKYEFKFTRGSNETWETTRKGEEMPNHEIALSEDATLNFNVEGWKDEYPDKPKPNTATAQVSIVDTAFYMPQLNRYRRIWAYLPKGYAKSTKRYPVIYMQDGQNLFNERTSAFGEWGIDEALDTLMPKLGREAIIIGIDNGGEKRMTEYNPYDNKSFGTGEGNQYVDFMALTLKPFIDKKFRTKKDSTNTFVAGSSMGAVISLYALVKYPKVYGGAGIFSPAFWTAPQLYDDVAKATFGRARKKFHFYGGGKESDSLIPDMDRMLAEIEKKGNYETNRVVNPVARHNEAAWREAFVEFYDFITR